MESSRLIVSDLRMCLVEGNRDFEFLTFYRGVQFVCPVELLTVTEERAYFMTNSPAAVLLDRERSAIALSNGLIDPFILRVAEFDIASGKLEATDMMYAGNMVGNRREHRVESDEDVMVELEFESQKLRGNLADISLSGAGVQVPLSEPGTELRHGKSLKVTLHLPEGDVQLPGAILRYRKTFSHHWLAIEFTGNAPGKAAILRHVNRRLKEIRAEVQKMYETSQPAV